MRTIEAVRRSGIGMGPDRSVAEVAAVMEQSGIGSVAVIDGTTLIGIVTDRDLVRRVLAVGSPPDGRVDAVMSTPVYVVDADADIHEALSLFRSHAVRRLGVVKDGEFVGMITVDDLLVELVRDLGDLTRPIGEEVRHAQRDSKLPATI